MAAGPASHFAGESMPTVQTLSSIDAQFHRTGLTDLAEAAGGTEGEGPGPAAAAWRPPASITGGEVTAGGPVHTLVDWLRFSGPESQRESIADVLVEFFGPVKETRKGLFYRKAQWVFTSGGAMHFGAGGAGTGDSVVVEVPGEACRLLGTVRALDLARRLYALPGVRCTRIDTAIDLFESKGAHLFDAVIAADQSWDIVRRPTVHVDRRGRGGEKTGEQVNIGVRAGSSKYMRIYDKGLEQSGEVGCLVCRPREWVRIEGEWKNNDRDNANEVCAHLMRVPEADLSREIGKVTLGMWDFRAWRDQAGGHATRRRSLPWFRDLVELVGGREVILGERHKSTVEGYRHWLRTAGRHFHRIVEKTGRDAAEVWSEVVQLGHERPEVKAGGHLEKICVGLMGLLPFAWHGQEEHREFLRELRASATVGGRVGRRFVPDGG